MDVVGVKQNEVVEIMNPIATCLECGGPIVDEGSTVHCQGCGKVPTTPMTRVITEVVRPSIREVDPTIIMGMDCSGILHEMMCDALGG